MKDLAVLLPALLIGFVLTAGCAGLEREPQPRPSAAAEGGAVASAPVARPAAPASKGSAAGNQAKPVASAPPAPAKVAASPAPAAPPAKTQTPAPPLVKPAAPPPLDLKSLETRLKETQAIGVFTKLALKNQIDDLLEQFRAFYQGRVKTTLAELRRSFDMLVMKTLALLQDADPPLAGALASSRESIWSILSDPAKFATV
jgi:hypothetical protein